LSKKITRGSNADYPLPKHITDEDFDALASVQRFTPEEKEYARERLPEIIDDVIAEMRAPKSRSGKSPGVLAEMIEQMIALHRKELMKSRELDRETRGALTDARSRRTLDVLTLDLVQDSPKYASEVARRREQHAASGFLDDDFERTLPMDVARWLYRDLHERLAQCQIDALEEVLRRVKESPRDKGGSPDLVWRTHLIRELANLYFKLRRNPTTTRTGKNKNLADKRGLFVDFVEGVFSAIGWPTAGIDRAVDTHLPPFRDLYDERCGKARDSHGCEEIEEPEAEDVDE
jgi:hypothetical protein